MNITQISPESFTAKLEVKCSTLNDKNEKDRTINVENIKKVKFKNDYAIITQEFGDIYQINLNNKKKDKKSYTPERILAGINTAKSGIDVYM